MKKRYAVVGLGSRSMMFLSAIHKDFKDFADCVAFCDINQTRMDYYNQTLRKRFGAEPVPTFQSERFDEMIQSTKPDTVIVTSIDRTHHQYIIRAMELGCDVISEKPMTTDAEKCQQILDSIKSTGKSLRITFNYRYAPRFTRIKELIRDGVIGEVKSIHFEWLLDTQHGADYFRRWHRDKRNSGGLMVHKATHHFDLVNWWTDSLPTEVFAMGGLEFYGRENAEKRGVTHFYSRGTGSKVAQEDPFALDLESDDNLRGLYRNAEHEDGYFRDQSVFGDGISIEDDMSVLVKYNSGIKMSYHLTAYSPWEGLRIAFNGTKGRLEYLESEKSYVSGSGDDTNRPDVRDSKAVDMPIKSAELMVRPLWQKPYSIDLPEDTGGHGGGDIRLLKDIFCGVESDPLGHSADHIQGAYSILTGIAANQSMKKGQPIQIANLVNFCQ